MEFQYRFTGTPRDLIDAHEVLRTAQSGMRPWVRRLLILLGLIWTAGGIVMLYERESLWPPLVSLALGLLVLWNFVVQPFRARRSIAANAAEQEVELVFSENGIRANVCGAGAFFRQWREVAQVLPSRKGFLFCFADGMNHWVPARAFRDRGEQQSLMTFVKTMRDNIFKVAS